MDKDKFLEKANKDIRVFKAGKLKKAERELSGFYRQRTWAGRRRSPKIVGRRIPKSVVI